MATSVNIRKYVVLHQYENVNGISRKIFFLLGKNVKFINKTKTRRFLYADIYEFKK